jgi:hypothetical protein
MGISVVLAHDLNGNFGGHGIWGGNVTDKLSKTEKLAEERGDIMDWLLNK